MGIRLLSALVLAAAILLGGGFGRHQRDDVSVAADPAAGAADAIVRFRSDATGDDRGRARQSARARFDRQLGLKQTQLVRPERGRSVADTVAALERDPDVLYAEPNVRRAATASANDTSFPYLWGLHNTGQTVRGVTGTADADVDAPEAWDVATGSGVTVAVVDTGVNAAHPELSSALWANPGESGDGRETNGLDDDGDGFVDDAKGWDFVESDSDPTDLNGHGTHVSGTIAARANNGAGVAGLAYDSRVMPLRVLDADGSGSVADAIDAYTFAGRHGARVLNASLGGASSSRAERDAIAAFPNTLFVVAAGNGGDDGVGDNVDTTPEYPCAYTLSNVVCVAASNPRDALTSFSNFGSTSVDLAAPGSQILSTYLGASPSYAYLSGTSMATPHAAAAAALVLSRLPSATTLQVRDALLTTTDQVVALNGRVAGNGRLNAYSAVKAIGPAPAPPTSTTPAPAPAPEPDAGLADPGPAASPGDAPVEPSQEPAPAPAVAAPDTAPPIVAVRLAPRQTIASLRRRGLTLQITCSEACSVRADLLLRTKRGSAALRRLSGARTRLAAAGRGSLRFRATGRLPLRRTRGVIKLRIADPGGNVRRVERSFVLPVR